MGVFMQRLGILGNVAGIPPPSIWDNVTFLGDHAGAAHGSTTLEDLAVNGTTNPNDYTHITGVTNDTGDSAFGSGSSVKFVSASSGYMSQPWFADMLPLQIDSSFHNDQFCWEFHIKTTSFASERAVYSMYHASGGGRVSQINITTGSKIFFKGYTNSGTNKWMDIVTTTVMSTDTWYHFAVTRENGVSETVGEEDIVRLFIDGDLEASGTCATAEGFPQITSRVSKFGNRDTSPIPFDGRLDNIRFTHGIPVYTANFTPLTARHPID